MKKSDKQIETEKERDEYISEIVSDWDKQYNGPVPYSNYKYFMDLFDASQLTWVNLKSHFKYRTGFTITNHIDFLEYKELLVLEAIIYYLEVSSFNEDVEKIRTILWSEVWPKKERI